MLTELDLGTNQLTALPEDVQELTRLETLVLSNNAIKVGHMTLYSSHMTNRVYHMICLCVDSAKGYICSEESSCVGPGRK